MLTLPHLLWNKTETPPQLKYNSALWPKYTTLQKAFPQSPRTSLSMLQRRQGRAPWTTLQAQSLLVLHNSSPLSLFLCGWEHSWRQSVLIRDDGERAVEEAALVSVPNLTDKGSCPGE